MMQIGRVIRRKIITRRMVQTEPNILFVFGDNMAGTGMGGQAAAMRGEPNAVGIPTKWRPGREEADYFTDADFSDPEVVAAIGDALRRLEDWLHEGHDVVIPSDGIGTGLAQLPQRAPRLHAALTLRLKRLTEPHAR